MMNDLRKKLSMILLSLALALGGCVSIMDGKTKPDYALIEFGAAATFTAIVNETAVSDDVVLETYNGLVAMENGLVKALDDSRVIDLYAIDQMLGAAVPIEYRAITVSGSKLIRSRVKKYLDANPPGVLPELGLSAKIALSVVRGAKTALGARVLEIDR